MKEKKRDPGFRPVPPELPWAAPGKHSVLPELPYMPETDAVIPPEAPYLPVIPPPDEQWQCSQGVRYPGEGEKEAKHLK